MDRIDGPGHVNGQFVTEDPDTNRPPTELTADWLNGLQEEALGVIEGVELVPDKNDNTQLRAAIRKMIESRVQSGSLIFSIAGGTANAMTAGFVPAITGLTEGMEVRVRCLGPNTSTTPTLQLDGLPAKTIVDLSGAALGLGAYAENWPAIFRYSETTDKFELLNPVRLAGNQFFSASGTFIVPAGITQLRISMCGGGGGGGAGVSTAAMGGGGGGAAAIMRMPITVTPGDSIAVTVGAGGVGAISTSGSAGGSSSFGAFVTTQGGGGGSTASTGIGGSNGQAPTGGVAGSPGQHGTLGSMGGGSLFGPGGANQNRGTGNPGGGYGAGGAGGYGTDAGGGGSKGFCLVEW